MKSALAYLLVILGVVSALAQDSLNVSLAGAYNHGWQTAQDIVVVGDYAYIAAGDSGLRVVNISNPAAMVETGSCFAGGNQFAGDLAVEGPYAYVACWSGLAIADISNPQAPVPVGQYAATALVRSVAIANGHAFLACNNLGLMVADVSNPQAVSVVGSLSSSGWSEGIALMDTLALVAHGEEGLQIVNIAVPETPVEIGYLDTPIEAHFVCTHEHYAYVADRSGGMIIIDLANPLAPITVGTYDTPSEAWAVCAAENMAYVADGDHGLRMVNVTDPANPEEVGHYFDMHSGGMYGVAVVGPYVYAAGGARISVYRNLLSPVTERTRASLPQCLTLCSYPNPFNATTVLRLDLPHDVDGRLAVYDVLGREVATLREGMMAAGSQSVRWDASGVTSGVYFVRFASGPFNATGKLMLLK